MNDTCKCCKGIERRTPMVVSNRPGLDALRYRVGTHATFLETMLAWLSSNEYAALHGLTTRDPSDPAIAVLDAWATVADVLTFYQERIANEGYLRTATERRSVLELARLVGYALRPGVAASVYLAYTVDENVQEEVIIPKGSPVQSVPGPGELPQTFETSEELKARAEWNALKPRLTRPQRIVLDANDHIDTDTVYLEGIVTNLKPNTPLLFFFDPGVCQAAFHKVERVEVDPGADRTKVVLQRMAVFRRAPLRVVRNVRGTMERYLDLESFGVLAATQMVRRVKSILKGVMDDLKPGIPFDEMVALLEEALPRLREEHAIAVEGDYSRLKPWVGGLVAELEAHREKLTTASSVIAVPRRALGLDVGSSVVGLTDLVSPLSEAPSVQPANAWELKRNIQAMFAKQSDTLPRLLTKFQPKLQHTLYKAWANATVTERPGLQRIEALRVEAAPFGHNAPLKPICDDEGRIIGREEWSLTDPVTTSADIHLPLVGGWLLATSLLAASHQAKAVSKVTQLPYMDISIEEGTTILHQRVPLGESWERPLEQQVTMGSHQVVVALGPLVRFARAIPGTAELCVLVEGEPVPVDWPVELPDGVVFSATTSRFPPGEYHFQFALGEEGPDPGWDATLTIQPGKLNSIVVVGDEPNHRKLVRLRDDLTVPSEDKVRLRVVHVAANFPEPIDVKLVDSRGDELAFLCEGLEYAAHRDESHFVETPLESGMKLQVLDGDKIVYEVGGLDLLAGGNCYDLYVHSIVPRQGDESVIQIVPSYGFVDSITDLAFHLDFQDLLRKFWMHLDGFDTQEFILTVQVTPDFEGMDWALGQGQKIQQTIEHKAIAIDFRQYPLVSYRARVPLPEDQWDTLILDAVYEQIVPGSCVVVERPGRDNPEQTEWPIFRVEEVRTVSQAAYGISGKATQLILHNDWLCGTDTDLSVLRKTTVYAQGELLTPAEKPEEAAVGSSAQDPEGGKYVELGGLYDGLESGRWLVVSGERADVGVPTSELVMLSGVEQSSDADVPGDQPHTTLILAGDGLAYTYKRDTVTIYGNVVKATHGETRREVLGSGDGGRALQSFMLKQPPLTYVAAPNASGVESTLEVFVNDVEWHEADTLVDLQCTDRCFVTKTDDEAKTTVVFGNGRQGARLPTGVENVRAEYRSGIGKAGNVKAGQITLLMKRPLGVKEVVNPQPASGGADKESRDQARKNAPLAVMALDRLVSVQDYADFARMFAGIGKANAVRLSDGRRELVHLTIAGADDALIEKHSDLYRNLVQALRRHGDPHQSFEVEVRDLLMLIVETRVRPLPDYRWESLEPRIRGRLLDVFGFERRELGQDVLYSEVVSAVQAVPGVAYVDLDVLDAASWEDVLAFLGQEQTTNLIDFLAERRRSRGEAQGEQPRKRVPVHLARPDAEQSGGTAPAQLAFLSPEVPDTLILKGI